MQRRCDFAMALALDVAAYDDFTLSQRQLVKSGVNDSCNVAMIERRRNLPGESVSAKRTRFVNAPKQLGAITDRFGIKPRLRDSFSRHALSPGLFHPRARSTVGLAGRSAASFPFPVSFRCSRRTPARQSGKDLGRFRLERRRVTAAQTATAPDPRRQRLRRGVWRSNRSHTHRTWRVFDRVRKHFADN